jgi:DNA-binding response OmpR family regulator
VSHLFSIDPKKGTVRLDGERARFSPLRYKIIHAIARENEPVSVVRLIESVYGDREPENPEVIIRVQIHNINLITRAMTGTSLLGCERLRGYYLLSTWQQGSGWLSEPRWALAGVML